MRMSDRQRDSTLGVLKEIRMQFQRDIEVLDQKPFTGAPIADHLSSLSSLLTVLVQVVEEVVVVMNLDEKGKP